MIILPNKDYRNNSSEKIATYQFLAKVDCPVFVSVLFRENEEINEEKLQIVKDVLKSEYCTVRYQYISPCSNPIRGGNKVVLTTTDLIKMRVKGTMMWLLQPIDRTKNIYGINVHVNRSLEAIIIECVGKGFDVSDLNRGDISPHQTIFLNYPIEYGWQNEWWKFIKIETVSYQHFNEDKLIRLKKLERFGLNPSNKIFDDKYQPLPYDVLEKLLVYIQNIDNNWTGSDEYIISISMNYDGKLVFWDIQTPNGKKKILVNY